MSFVIAVLLVLILLALLNRPHRPAHVIDSFDVPPPVPVKSCDDLFTDYDG